MEKKLSKSEVKCTVFCQYWSIFFKITDNAYCHIFLIFYKFINSEYFLFCFRVCRKKVNSSEQGQFALQDTNGRLVAARKMSLGELLHSADESTGFSRCGHDCH